jgi:hypothetical protein
MDGQNDKMDTKTKKRRVVLQGMTCNFKSPGYDKVRDLIFFYKSLYGSYRFGHIQLQLCISSSYTMHAG